MAPSSQSAVLIPVKSFEVAKGRLASTLSPAKRAELARQMAATVIRASKHLPAWVICDDKSVASFAVANGAGVIWRPAAGLNQAMTDGVQFAKEHGYGQVVLAHADLPLAKDLTWVAPDPGQHESSDQHEPTVTIVPDRHGDGTNVMCLPVNVGFTFAYGVGSCTAHQAEANRLGLRLRLRPDADLGWDVDTADDLAVFDAQATASTPADSQATDSQTTDSRTSSS